MLPQSQFDQGLPPVGAGLVSPACYDASPRAMRLRTVGWAAKRYVDMLYVTGLDRATADAHFRPRMTPVPGDLATTPEADVTALQAAIAGGRFTVTGNDATRNVAVTWADPEFGDVTAHAEAHPGYGGILLGEKTKPDFTPAPLARPSAAPLWDHAAPPPSAALAKAADALFAGSPGIYGVLLATPERLLFERYSSFGGADRVTPSWSMTKSITGTIIGRLLHKGWLRSVYDRAIPPLWADPRGIHAGITLDDLLRMRSGLAMPIQHADGSTTLGFENALVYQQAGDAFDTAQRGIPATQPGAVYRYINAGPNVLGAIIRAEIEQRGLPYPATLYGLLADRIGMQSYQHSADSTGNMIASGAGFATLRDYARLGVLYLQDGVWQGERILPEGWVSYALSPSHIGTDYAGSFWTNQHARFPSLPRDTAWATGLSDQRVIIMRGANMIAVVTNENDFPLNLGDLDRFLATGIGV